MNERIKQLAEQAGMHDFVLEAMGIGEEFEKFAELIVLECDRYARSTWEHGELLGGDLKRLFGIE